MMTRTLTQARRNFCGIIKESAGQEVLLTRRGKPAAIIIGFHDEDDWFDYQLEHDERFLKQIARAREEIKQGKFVTLDELPD